MVPPNKMNQFNGLDILLLQDEAVTWDLLGQGAGILSFKSQRKLIPEDMSNVASDGKLGKRHPTSVQQKEETNNDYGIVDYTKH